MRKICFVLIAVVITIMNFGCDKEDAVVTSTPPPQLSASATSIVLLTEGSATIVISNGTEPYSISDQPNTTIAEVQMTESRTLSIVSKSLGSTTVKVKDSSTPSKTVTISINVVAAYTSSVSGSLSFNSNRGDISISGIGSIENSAPTSGAGVIALGEFSGSNTNLAVGSYGYPSSGKVVMISYQQGVNPNDSLSMDRGYILATSALANIETLSSSVIKGTFSGVGYYIDNGTPVPSQTINVTNGVFNAPIVQIGKKQESVIEKIVLQSIKRLK